MDKMATATQVLGRYSRPDSTIGRTMDDQSLLISSEEEQHTENTNTVKVYSYACKITYPMDAAHVEHQLTLTHRHRNLLTEALLQGRKQYRQIIREHLGLDIEELESQANELTEKIAELKTQLAEWKKQNRTNKTNPDLAATLRQLSAERKPVFEKIKSVKKAAKEDAAIKPLLEQANRLVDATIKEACNNYSNKFGLYWPNYLENERSARQARFQRSDPKFRRWTGEGSIAIQFQGGLLVRELFDCQHTQLRIVEPARGAARSKGQIRGRDRHVRGLYRVQSNEDGSPRWITLNIIMHRILPSNGIIKWAHLKRVKSSRAIGKTSLSLTKDYDYSLLLTVEEPPQKAKPQAKVAIELGWRLFEQGLRVAVALGEDGDLKELYLPRQTLDGKRKAESLLSIIDRNTNQTVEAIKAAHPELSSKLAWAGNNTRRLASTLLQIRRENPAPRLRFDQIANAIAVRHPEISAGLVQAGKNQRRLSSALLKIWQQDPALWPRLDLGLELWYERHLHLLRYQRGLQDPLIRSRREIYRKFVAELSRKYSICGIEDFDLRQVTRKDNTKDQVHDLVKWQRTIASVSSLRLMLSQRMILQKLPNQFTTQKCHNCGFIEEWNSAQNVWHQCSRCQSKWDQDHNAAQNLLDLLRENVDNYGKEGSARQAEGLEGKGL